MVFQDAKHTIAKMVEESGNSIHAMALKAEVSYPTVFAWSKGTTIPTVTKFARFLRANGYELRVVKRI